RTLASAAQGAGCGVCAQARRADRGGARVAADSRHRARAREPRCPAGLRAAADRYVRELAGERPLGGMAVAAARARAEGASAADARATRPGRARAARRRATRDPAPA